MSRSVEQVLQDHRSVRNFTESGIDPSLIEEIIKIAIAGTASYGNLNCASIVITQEKTSLDVLRMLHFSQTAVATAPAILTMCADTGRLNHWLATRGASNHFNDVNSLAIAVIDTLLLAQSVVLALESRGLGTCFLGTTLDNCREITRFLALPQFCIPVISIAIGYPAHGELPKSERMPLEAYLHREKYQAKTSDELLLLYELRERVGWNRVQNSFRERLTEFEELGITNFARFCTSHLKYPADICLVNSSSILCLILEQGFTGSSDGVASH